MKKSILLSVFCAGTLFLHAQITDPKQAASQGATDHVNNNISNGVNNSLDKTEGAIKGLFKKKPKTAKTDSTKQGVAAATGAAAPSSAGAPKTAAAHDSTGPSLNAYSNYDFVPGEKILLEEHFTDDPTGEFPTHWRLCYGQAVIAVFDGKKVFALTEGEQGDNAVVMEPRMKKNSGYLPDAFTVELDLYIPHPSNSDDDIRNNWVGLNFYGTNEPINSYTDLSINSEQLEFYSGLLSDGKKQLPDDVGSENFLNKWHHLAIAYRNKQMKVYLDQTRLYVVPEVKDSGLNKFGVRVSGKCVVTNIRLAEGGGMNMIGKKFTDARIVTHGINFDVDKATIKPESMGTLNMIVQVLKDNPDLKFEVDGHTDNSGNAAHNLQLSQQRADAVKAQLIAMGVAATRLSTKGFGDTKPISDNATPEGKANNRRVEFVKI